MCILFYRPCRITDSTIRDFYLGSECQLFIISQLFVTLVTGSGIPPYLLPKGVVEDVGEKQKVLETVTEATQESRWIPQHLLPFSKKPKECTYTLVSAPGLRGVLR